MTQTESTARMRRTLCTVMLSMIAPALWAASVAQKTFESPEAGVSALVEAAKTNDQPQLSAILGMRGLALFSSGDAVADKKSRETFVNSYADAHRIALEGQARATLTIGNDEWPLPIPLVKSADGWRFDAQQGEREILERRIGRNELAAIQVCLAIVDAERDYVANDQDRNGVLEYARKLVSTPGKRDGLYWATAVDEKPSPLGPLLAAATREGYIFASSASLAPYHGYYYRILTKQGPNAKGGAYDYVAKGKMIGGFAVLAYPARYAVSGVMSFSVNQDGVVYEKDLGKNTAALAAKMTSFDPDPSWKQP